MHYQPESYTLIEPKPHKYNITEIPNTEIQHEQTKHDEEKDCWCWKKPPPASKKGVQTEYVEDGSAGRKRRRAQNISARERLLKEFSCNICRKVMTLPITTPCAHNFCKACLDQVFSGQSLLRHRNCEGRRTLRAQKNVMKCPSCSIDIAEFLQNPQVNRELMNVIESLKQKDAESEENNNAPDDAREEAEMSDEEDEDDKEGEKMSDAPKNAEEVKDDVLKPDVEIDVQETLKQEKPKGSPKSDAKRSENGASEEETKDAMKPEDDAKDEPLQAAKKESKGRQSPKRKKAENGSVSPLGTVGAMTRCKRAKAEAAK